MLGHNNIDTIQSIAEALKPVAGKYAFALFSIGVILEILLLFHLYQ